MREPHTMAELQGECSLLIGKAELLRLRPDAHHFCRGDARLDHADRLVEKLSAMLVGIHQSLRGAANGKGAVITGAVAHEAMDYVKIGRVAGAKGAIAEHVRVRTAPLTRDSVNAFHIL